MSERVCRIAVVGGESTGKSTLSAALAERLGGVHVPEFARDYLLRRGSPDYPIAETLAIAGGQVERERTAIDRAQETRRETRGRRDPTDPRPLIVVADSDAMSTILWSRYYFGEALPELVELAEANKHDAYLLCAPDLPWEDDGLRRSRGSGDWFDHAYRAMLSGWGRPWTRVGGSVAARVAAGVTFLRGEGLIGRPEG